MLKKEHKKEYKGNKNIRGRKIKEEIISKIVEVDSSFGKNIKEFYELCLKFNRFDVEMWTF